MLQNSTVYKRTRKDHVLNNEAIKLKKEYCENCFVQFKIVNLKFSHNCKRCFRTVCDSCGQQREKIIGCLEKPEANHRICNMCKEERNSMTYFIQKNYLKWGQTSSICDRWLESLGLFLQKKELNTEYQNLTQQIKKNWTDFEAKTPELEQVKKDLKEFHSAAIRYNYSFCEVLHQLQGDVTNDQLSQEVYNIMVRFLFKYPDVGYTREYLKVITFLMCFCTQQEAYFIFSNIIYYIVPPPLYPKEAKKNKMETVEKYLQYIIDDIVDQKGFGEENILLVKQFLSGNYFLYYQSFFINYLQFNVCFSIIDNIIMKRDFKEVEKYIKAISFKHIVNMRAVGSNTDQLNEVILRWTTKVSDLDQIITKNFKNKTHQYHLDLLEKNNQQTSQGSKIKKEAVQEDNKTIENLKGDLETMNQYSEQISKELDNKIKEYESLKNEQNSLKRDNDSLKNELENLKKAAPKNPQVDQQMFENMKSQFDKKLKELENDKKNLKCEVFENDMKAMKMSKQYDEDLAALNQKLLAAQDSLKKEQMKVQKLLSDIDQMKKQFSENEKKYIEMINQERTKTNTLTNQCKMMQSKLQSYQAQQNSPQTLQVPPQPNGSETNRQGSAQTLQLPSNNVSLQSSPQHAASKSVTTLPRMPSSPNDTRVGSMTAIPPSPNTNSPKNGSVSAKSDPQTLQISQQQSQIQSQQSQIQQQQQQIQQQQQTMMQMRQRGEQLAQQLNSMQKEFQLRESKLKEAEVKFTSQNQKIEELQEEIESKDMSITLVDKNNKTTVERFQKDLQEKNQKIEELCSKLQKQQEQVEKLIMESKRDEKNSEQLFQLQLGQKQASIEQKATIIRDKDSEMNHVKQKNLDFQKQIRQQERQIQNIEKEKGELQEKISSLEEEIHKKENLLQKFQESIGSQDIFNVKEKNLLDREKELSTKSSQLEQQKQDLKIKETELQREEEKLKELENQLKEQQLQVIEKQEEIQETQNKLKQTESELKKKNNDIYKSQETLVQKQIQLQEKENQLFQKESEIVKEKENLDNLQTSLNSQKKQIAIQEASVTKDREDFKTKEQNFQQKQKFLQELQMQISTQQQELVKQKEILFEERKAVQSRLGDLDNIGKSAAEEEALKRQKQIKELGDFLQKMESKLNAAHLKMKEDSNILSQELGLNIDLNNNSNGDNYLKEQQAEVIAN